MGHRMCVYQALVYFILVVLTSAYAFLNGIDGTLLNKEALEGGNTTLNCDTTSAIGEDELMLLVWYKGDESIYSFDARSNSEWSSQTFNTSGRVSTDISERPTPLYVSTLRADDEALYHCRVEFLLTPTRYTGINLTVVVLPSKPFFLDELGNKVENKIGPYFEGDTLVINCLVIGGRPPPDISWYSGEVLVDASGSDSDIPNVRQNELYLPLTRDTNALSCKASNTVLSPPIVSYVDIELYLSANNVSIQWLQDIQEGLRAGDTYIVKCTALEVYPSPDIAWWLNRKHLTQYSNQTWNNIKKTAESYLQLTPTMVDDGATLACVATNPAVPAGKNSKADVLTLNVTYVPTVEVSSVGTGQQNGVVENDTFRLICDVKANPRADRFIWYFNNTNIIDNNEWQDNVFGNTLIINKAKRTHTGQYSCSAGNSVGEGKAEEVNIIVLYPPECTDDGVSLLDEVIVCRVNAVPDPNLFLWYIHTDSQFENFTTQSSFTSLSKVTISLTKTVDITCAAKNGIATQEKPCTKSLSFKHLRPPAPRRCDLSYENDQFQIHCIPVENATHYEVTVSLLSRSNASLILNHKSALGFGAQALSGSAEDGWLVGGQLGTLNKGDEAGAAACNRYGCSKILLLRPTEKLLNDAVPPWYSFLDKEIGIIVGGVVLVIVFVISTAIAVAAARRSRAKQPVPVIQVVEIDEFTREFLNSTRDLKARSSCSLRSRNSDYSERTEEVGLTTWRQVPVIHDTEPPPDVTLTMHRESAV